jgi:putative SOS response-associated peptidase YedK
MCYSAMVKQGLKSTGLRVTARIQTDLFEQVFRRRVRDNSVKIAKALEANFENPATPDEARIKAHIDAYRGRRNQELEAGLFAQKKRLADAERSLGVKETKKALDEKRIASNKIAWHLEKLAELRRTTPEPSDSRIFPFWIAPVIVMEGGEYLIKPMRYHCRANDKPASYDRRYPGLYNARRDNLDSYWKNLFGKRHGILLITSFYENVSLHDFEKRPLRKGEAEQNLILHFNPRPTTTMILACLRDHWERPGETDLYSFAAITDDPPPEVAATGHNRCVIPLREQNLERWLTPAGRDKSELNAILDDRERPYYEHELAA